MAAAIALSVPPAAGPAPPITKCSQPEFRQENLAECNERVSESRGGGGGTGWGSGLLGGLLGALGL